MKPIPVDNHLLLDVFISLFIGLSIRSEYSAWNGFPKNLKKKFFFLQFFEESDFDAFVIQTIV